jgi:hypothetical protein
MTAYVSGVTETDLKKIGESSYVLTMDNTVIAETAS